MDRAGEPTPLEVEPRGDTSAPPGVPVPYPDMDGAPDHGARSVRTDGDPVSAPASEFPPSEGDEPGTGGPGLSRLPGGAPLLVAVIVIVLLVVIASIVLLSGDDDHGDDLVIDPDWTVVDSVWEPTPGIRLSVVVRNEGDDTASLDGHDLLVTVLQGTEEVGQTTMVLSGDMDAGSGRGVLIIVGVDLTSGETYEVNVLLRKDGTVVDTYSTEVTIEQV